MHEEALRCGNCGTQRWEWEPKQGGSRTAYHPFIEICPGCERKGMAFDDHAKHASSTNGVFVVLLPSDVARERLMAQRKNRSSQ